MHKKIILIMMVVLAGCNGDRYEDASRTRDRIIVLEKQLHSLPFLIRQARQTSNQDLVEYTEAMMIGVCSSIHGNISKVSDLSRLKNEYGTGYISAKTIAESKDNWKNVVEIGLSIQRGNFGSDYDLFSEIIKRYGDYGICMP